MKKKVKIRLIVTAIALVLIASAVCARFRPLTLRDLSGGKAVQAVSVMKQETFGERTILYNILYQADSAQGIALQKALNCTYLPVSTFLKQHELSEDVVELTILFSDGEGTALALLLNNYGEIVAYDGAPGLPSDYRLVYFDSQPGKDLYTAVDRLCQAPVS